MIKFIVILIFLFPTLNYSQDIKIILNEMSREEKQALVQLFYILMQEEHFSYSLFGDKPISLTANFTLTPYQCVLNGQNYGGVFWKRWSIWKRYESFFSISQYIFIEESSLTEPNSKTLIFINKTAFIKKVNNHLNTFKEILEYYFTADELYTRISKTRKFTSIIKNNEILRGILLGYGIHNAKLYDRKLNLEELRIPKKIPSPSPQFSSIDEEYEFLDHKLIGTNKCYYTPLILPFVGFAADPNHEETIALMKNYKRLQAEISSIYAKGDFLEIILSQLTRD